MCYLRRMGRVGWIALAITIAACGSYLGVGFYPGFHLAYDSHAARAALETAGAFTSVLLAYLALGRVRKSASVSDIALVTGFLLLAVTNFLFGAVLAAAPSLSAVKLLIWMPGGGRLGTAIALVVAAYAPALRVRRPLRALSVTFTGALVLLALAAVVTHLIADESDERVAQGVWPSTDLVSAFHEPPSVLQILQFVRCALLALAAYGFFRRARREEGLFLWLAGGSLLSAYAAAARFLFPPLYSDWITPADILRVGSYGILLIGVVSELRAYERGALHALKLDERRRLAREIHDGLAQELALIAREAADLARLQDPAALRVARAAERALTESRHAIAALAAPPDEPLDLAIAAAVEPLATRADVALDLRLAPGVRVNSEEREALLRIAREAVANALRHGNPSWIKVELWNGSHVHLRVTDDGDGFDPMAVPDRDRFGLTSMAERALAVGGYLRVRSQPAAGTRVEAVMA
jgi:signal transduction histidine kinase